MPFFHSKKNKLNTFSLKFKCLGLFLFIFFLNNNIGVTAEIYDIDKQLKAADNIRSSDHELFNKILATLKIKEKSLSISQKYYLNYLFAYQQSFKGQFDKAIQSYKKILSSTASNNLKFRANSSIVNISAITQDWTVGLSHLTDNFKMLEEINDQKIKEDGLIIAAIFYNLIGQYTLGQTHADNVLKTASSDRNLCIAKQLSLESQFKSKKLAENSISITKGLNACLKANEIIMASAIRTYLANLYLSNGKHKKAINLLIQTQQDVEKSNYPPMIAEYYSVLSKAYFLENAYQKAIVFANKTLVKTQNSKNSPQLIQAHFVLYEIALKNKQYSTALEHYQKYAAANTAHLEDEKAKHLAFQLAEHQAFQQKSKIKLLNEQNSLLKIEQKLTTIQAENNRLFIALLIAIISLLTFFAYRSWSTQKRLKHLSEYDALTGIYNRGHFNTVAKNAITYCKKTQQELSVIMFDLDKFKDINDSFGHACGDWALQETVKACKKISRNNDIFARLGGEEFCILLSSCNIKQAQKIAEIYRQAIAKISTTESSFEFTITASFGITDSNYSNYNLEALLKDADDAMYHSKNNGRNQLTLISQIK